LCHVSIPNFNVSDDNSFVILLHYCIQCRGENLRQDILAGLSNFQSRVTTSQSYYNALAKRFAVDDNIERMWESKSYIKGQACNMNIKLSNFTSTRTLTCQRHLQHFLVTKIHQI